MANKPDMLFWVPDNDAGKIQDPGGSKKAAGFLYKEKPAYQFVNYLYNRIYQWLKGVQGAYCQVVVGSASQVTAGSATHTVNQLTDVVVTAGSRVLFLEGTHLLTGDITLSNANCTFDMENGGAIIDLNSTYKFALTGARAWLNLKFANVTAAVDAVQVTGASSFGTVVDVDPSNITGSSSGLLMLPNANPSLKIGIARVPSAAGNLTDGATIAWDLSKAEIASVTLGGDRTLSNPTNLRTGRFTLLVKQDGTGGRVLSYDTAYTGYKVLVNPAANAVTVINFVCDGTNMIFPEQSATTGDGKLTLKAVADPGWIMANDGTIGSAASGATTRAKADTADLYALLWNNVSNANAPIQDSAGTPTVRGGSAAADFAANKRLSLTRHLGRGLAVGGSGAGLTARALGDYLGEETHTLITAELPAHTHQLNDANTQVQGAGGNNTISRFDLGYTQGRVTGSTGGDGAHNNMQPSTFVNFMIKL